MVAGAQILAWIAMPHRPQPGVRLLNQWFWARRRFRKERVPVLPFELGKPNRITAQLVQFDRRVLDAFRAGAWFDRRRVFDHWRWIDREKLTVLPEGSPIVAGLRGFGASTRQLAKSYAGRNGIEQGNAIRAIWSRRKPVLHLASAAAEVLAARYADENRQGFDLERTVFWPNWVADTIDRAEQKAEAAARYGVFPLSDFHRFHRDKN